LNTPILVDEATANPRYRWERNRAVPRKIGSQLWLYDCINCDKCVPVCPNDANFVYETPSVAIEYDNFELLPGRIRSLPGGVLRVVKARQLANFADACNECGNCDIFCPEDGGPHLEKPRFFGSLAAYQKYAGGNGFLIDWESGRIHGVVDERSYILKLCPAEDRAWLDLGWAEVELRLSDNQPLSWKPKGLDQPASRLLDMLSYLKLKLLAEAVGDPRHINFANVGQAILP
jgi:putative selenate reductase